MCFDEWIFWDNLGIQIFLFKVYKDKFELTWKITLRPNIHSSKHTLREAIEKDLEIKELDSDIIYDDRVWSM
jgi:hypothetical protein